MAGPGGGGAAAAAATPAATTQGGRPLMAAAANRGRHAGSSISTPRHRALVADPTRGRGSHREGAAGEAAAGQ
eukprot:5179337-Alexandrium_andersonii.AAC.1